MMGYPYSLRGFLVTCQQARKEEMKDARLVSFGLGLMFGLYLLARGIPVLLLLVLAVAAVNLSAQWCKSLEEED